MTAIGEYSRLLLASTIGTILEWYDFFIFATCAVLVFDKVFFPAADTYTGILLGLSTYAAGFAARPLGGIVFGIWGDRIGRRKTLILSMVLMGAVTTAIGLLPDYKSIGILAPALLVGLRILQGIAVGGEAPGALLIVAESLPAGRRGFWTGFPMIGGPAANVLAAFIIGAVQTRFGEDAFEAWAWRIPFLLSSLLMLFGLWARSRIEESPAFLQMQKRNAMAPIPFIRMAKLFRKPMGQVFLVKAAENTLLRVLT